MNANFVLLRKNGSHKAFPLTGDITTVGRRHDCDLQIPLPTVSRKHCQLTLNKDTVELRDLGSRAGTFVNGKRVEEEVDVKAGDYVRIGPLTFVYQIDGKPAKIAPPKKAPVKAKTSIADDDTAIKANDDLDASGSFLDLDALDDDELDADLEDLKNI